MADRQTMQEAITGLILAGGKGTRMGGVDKGLQLLKDRPLVSWVLDAMWPQVHTVLVNANRSRAHYLTLGLPVLADPRLTDTETTPDFAGPLAGMLAGLRACQTPWLVTAPCDTPIIPSDYVERLYRAAQTEARQVAMVMAPELDALKPSDAGAMRRQPVFCLIHRDLADDLALYLASGERKIDRWTDRHHAAMVAFTPSTTPAFAFANINTLQELGALEKLL